MRATSSPFHYHKNVDFKNRVVVFQSSFRPAGRSTFCGKAKLFGDRIELHTWGLTGHRKKVVHLTRVAHVDYHPLEKGSNLSFFLEDGARVDLNIDEAHQWREHFENWVRYAVLPSAKLVNGPEEALGLSG